ncbi:MAG: hypothetical protein H6546_00860 [Chitinophagales bacterium]|nr:hypothetical protein [Chitinophagales bacterium]
MMMLGRTWEAESSYRFGFGGKEVVEEIYHSSRVSSYSERTFDVALGRWLEVDPLTAKYPALSPYLFSFNNPISYVDPEGSDNVIYLVVLPSSKTSLSKTDVNNIVNQANENFQNLGLNTRVVLATDVVGSNVYAFDPNNSGIDPTDAIAVIGSADDVTGYISDYNQAFADKLITDKDWGNKGDPNQAIAENGRGLSPTTEKGGSWIAIDASQLEYTSARLGITLSQAGGWVLNHEAGHNAGLDHFGSKEGSRLYQYLGYTDSQIMRDYKSDIDGQMRENGYEYMTSNSTVEAKPQRGIRTTQNQDYRSRMIDRFGKNESKVNYEK